MGDHEKVFAAFAGIRGELDKYTVGYSEFKNALVIAFIKQALGIRGHVLAYGPAGVAKTVTTKGLASILQHMGVEVPYKRVQGNPDLMPSDFLFRRTSEYDGDGRLNFVWKLQTIGSFQRFPDGEIERIFPSLFQFDEIDKVTANGQFGLLEVTEEQQVSVLDGRIVPLNFVLVATANTRQFDPTAKPLATSVKDRFGATVLLNYLGLEQDVQILERKTQNLAEPEISLRQFPLEELKRLRDEVRQNGLPLQVSSEIRQGIATVVKLTQRRLDDYTDFTRFIKVPSGPRGMLNLFWEAAIQALLSGDGEIRPKHLKEVGVRALRGRVEVTPESQHEDKTTDVVLRKILAEVFRDSSGQAPQGDQDPGSFMADMRHAGQRAPGGHQRPPGPRQGTDGDGDNGSEDPEQDDEKSEPPNDQEGSIKTVVSRETLANFLVEQMPDGHFNTTEGTKTSSEIASDLSSRTGKFDFHSTKGNFKAHAIGDKAIVEGSQQDIQNLADQEADKDESSVGKGSEFPNLDGSNLPPSVISILPILREKSPAEVVEILKKWLEIDPRQRTRTGAEYRLIKGFAYLAGLKAVASAEDVDSSELTVTHTGERVEFVTGERPELPLDEERTLIAAMDQGGVVDADSEVHEKRVRADAPQLFFVVDGSASMGIANRMMSTAVAATACAQKYGPLGATLGLEVFASHPTIPVPMPETEVERIVDEVFSIEPTGGTSYARALELAFRHALPKTSIVVIGDFDDYGQPSTEALANKATKDQKVIGIVSSDGNAGYATEICDEVYAISMDDPTAVALIALKAAIS